MFSENGKDAVLCDNVSFIYPDGTQALNQISLKISCAEKVGIIGPNGAGKSTFLHLLNGIKQGRGQIRIFEWNVEKNNLKKIKTLVGLVFQNPDDQLFCPTIYDDVAFAPMNFGINGAQLDAMVEKALQEVGLEGYEKRSSLNISYGEKKLAAIASILSMQPKILAMDEPTSNLDPLHRRKIIRWIQNCGLTCLLTSHDLDMIAETCDRVYIFREGSIVAAGDTSKILKNRQLLESNNLELPLKWQ